MLQNKKLAFLAALLFGSNLIWAGASLSSQNQASRYPLLSRSVVSEESRDVLLNFAPLREALNLYFSKINYGHSFYFEYLPTGTSIQIAGESELVGASLLKVPVVMTLYRTAELGQIDLDKKVALKEEWLDRNFGTLWQKGEGYEISLREVAHLALVMSDNTAANAVLHSVGHVIQNNEDAFNRLDISFRATDGKAFIGAKAYSSAFKCLYFSCYLNPDNSQEILTRLTETSFKSRLVEGVGDGTKISHKIGSFSEATQSDCGIVYLPRRPYLLCIMVNVPENEADPIIAQAASLVHSFLKDQ